MHGGELFDGGSTRVEVDTVGIELQIVDAGRGGLDPARPLGVTGECVVWRGERSGDDHLRHAPNLVSFRTPRGGGSVERTSGPTTRRPVSTVGSIRTKRSAPPSQAHDSSGRVRALESSSGPTSSRATPRTSTLHAPVAVGCHSRRPRTRRPRPPLRRRASSRVPCGTRPRRRSRRS